MGQGIADRLQLGTVIPLSGVKDDRRRAMDRLSIALARDRSSVDRHGDLSAPAAGTDLSGSAS
jgi:hypothetical protein